MLSRNNNVGVDSIIEMLSHTGANAVLSDMDGKILGFTQKFASVVEDCRRGLELGQFFDGLPQLPLAQSGGSLQLTVRKSGRGISAHPVCVNAGIEMLALLVTDDTGDYSRDEERNPVPHASDDLIFQFNTAGRVYYVSSNVEAITGYNEDDFTSGRISPLDIVHPDDRPALERDFNDLFVSHRGTENSEHRIIKKSGEIGYLLKSWYALFDSRGRFSGVMGLNKDITKEKLLRERMRLFESAFEHSTDAIVITGTDGKIIDVNGAFTHTYGFSRGEAIGKSTSLIQSRHSTPDFYNNMWQALERDNQWRGEILNRRKDGTEIPVWLSITPIYYGDKKIGYMGIESDMSEQKNLEQQIIQTEKLATIGQLAAGIAHEIGTPLNIISGNAEFILLDMKESDAGYRELETIIQQTKRMSVLMRQLLDFARPKVLSLQNSNVNKLLDEVLSFVRLQFQRQDIGIETDFDRDLPGVYGDPALLYQVFLNIIMNAFQAMSKEGLLTVRTRTIAGGKVEKLKIEIADTGEGIRQENLDRIFTPFFTTKQPGKGTGLGLAVTRRIIQEHNGEIDIKSTFGKGTTVTITFNAFRQKTVQA